MYTSESRSNPSLDKVLTEPAIAPTITTAQENAIAADRESVDPHPEATAIPDLSLDTDQFDWLNYFKRCSRLLVAVIEPVTLTLQEANDYFCKLMGVVPESARLHQPDAVVENVGSTLQRLLSRQDNLAVQKLYCRHLLHRIFRDLYQVSSRACRLLDEPIMLTIQSPLHAEPRYLEFWLRSERLAIARKDTAPDEFAEFGLQHLALPQLEAMLMDPQQLHLLEQKLQLENYQIQGHILLEGLDVTDRETIRRITQLLVERDSILNPSRFQQVDQQMRILFHAQNTVVISIEADQTRLFMGTLSPDIDTNLYSLESLQGTRFMEAVQSNQVLTVADLAQTYKTAGGKKIVAMGVRSLLLIPLVSHIRSELVNQPSPVSTTVADSRPVHCHTLGMVVLFSDRPHNFDGVDCRHAEQLIPAFTAALMSAQHQLVQQRFITSIHPAVEWRFLQEAERRSLGLPSDPIIFDHVYPLYGISDIRGSSDERNRAIQADLIAQYRLGLAVVEAACAEQEIPLAEQLRQDLQEHISQLEHCVTVDAEVTGLRYLQDNLEIYFDYFLQCGTAAKNAIAAYQTSCTNNHEGVYQARANYDRMVGLINSTLRETWERWQSRMQKISPHYCDMETTDGIDHMIYAGRSIDPKFGHFQLRSLRYEQLRAICDCARSIFQLKAQHEIEMEATHLVLVQDSTIDIFHDETTEKLFEVRGTRDMRYEIVKKRIDKAVDEQTKTRITQSGMLTIVYSTDEELAEYQRYLRYLHREGWVDNEVDQGAVQPLQGVNGLKYARVKILPGIASSSPATPESPDL